MLTREETKKGASLELLALYLPYGIELEMLWFPLDEDRHRLSGLDGEKILLSEGKACSPNACLPVLRPFRHITKRFSDGKIPLVEVARLALNSNYAPTRRMYQLFDFKQSRIPHPYPDAAYVYVDHRRLCEHTVKVDKDFNTTVSVRSSIRAHDCWNQVAIIDYLRSQHFALPVNGRPLVEGVDYITK